MLFVNLPSPSCNNSDVVCCERLQWHDRRGCLCVHHCSVSWQWHYDVTWHNISWPGNWCLLPPDTTAAGCIFRESRKLVNYVKSSHLEMVPKSQKGHSLWLEDGDVSKDISNIINKPVKRASWVVLLYCYITGSWSFTWGADTGLVHINTIKQVSC